MPSKPDCPARRAAATKRVDHLLDFGLAHAVAAVAVVKGGKPRGRPVGLEGIVEVAMLADMVELVEDHRAMGVDGIGDLAEMRDDLVGRMAEIAAGQHRGAVNRHRLDHDHGGAADGALLVIGAMALAREAALRHVGGVGAEDDAVGKSLVA